MEGGTIWRSRKESSNVGRKYSDGRGRKVKKRGTKRRKRERRNRKGAGKERREERRK